jgi:hypothetical protein
MKAFLIIIGLLLIGGCVWIATESSKPAVVALVDVSKDTLYITNGNDRPWPVAKIILNDAFDGPRVESGPFPPGVRMSLPLSDFTGLLNKQRFRPDYERVSSVIIQVEGYQLGSYQTRR